MKLLMFGHWSHTGFGTVTAELGARFLGLGVDVRILAVNHRGEPVRGPLAGRVWPTNIMGDNFGGNIGAEAIDGSFWATLDPDDDWKPGVVLCIADVSSLLGYMGQLTESRAAAWKSVPVYHYCPIEGDNLPPAWRQVWSFVSPIAMSDYGARVIGEHVGHPVPRIYHGVDTEAFHPATPGNPIRFDGETLRGKDDCKRKFGLDGRKVLLRADRNAHRKFYYRTLEAFVPIAQADPLVDLVLHCRAIDPEGPDLVQELYRMPEDIRPRVKFTNAHDTFKGLPIEGLAALYNAADIYISTTGGEGFGLTLAESLACGTPVIVTDWAADAETVGDGGVLIPPLMDSYGQPVRYHSTFGMDFALPDPTAFVQPTLDLLAHPGHRNRLGANGRLHVKRSFNWDVAASQFLSLFETNERIIGDLRQAAEEAVA